MLQHIGGFGGLWVEFFPVEASMQASSRRASVLKEPLHAIWLEYCPLLLCCFFTSFSVTPLAVRKKLEAMMLAAT